MESGLCGRWNDFAYDLTTICLIPEKIAWPVVALVQFKAGCGCSGDEHAGDSSSYRLTTEKHVEFEILLRVLYYLLYRGISNNAGQSPSKVIW